MVKISIDENTHIPLYVVGACIPFVVGAILWLTAVASDAKEAKSEVRDLKTIVIDIQNKVTRMDQLIEDKLK